MQVKFKEKELQECQTEWNKLDPRQRITMDVYDLAELTDIKDHERWVAFLKHPIVTEKINEELKIFKQAQQRKLISLATDKSTSVGTSQLINAIGNAVESEARDTSGQVFIYSYVPLNAKEMNAPDVREEGADLFRCTESKN